MPESNLKRIAGDFERLAVRFEEYKRCAVRAEHLATDLQESAIHAGRLLVIAIDGGAFPESRADVNRAWWSRTTGRVPGGPAAVGLAPRWRKGDSAPSERDEYKARASGEWEPGWYSRCWTFAVGSWLAPAFPDRFRHNAAEWDWKHVATDASGRPVGKDGKTLRGQWYKNGEPLPDDFEPTREDCREGLTSRLDGELTHVSDSYDGPDWLAHHRARAEVYADACRLLAELVEGEPAKPTHSPDFTSVEWFGTRYTFSKGNQAESVRVLWDAWENGGHSLSQETIGDKVSPQAERFELAKVFRGRKRGGRYKMHPAWGTMIRQATKGSYQLAPPESA